MQSFITSVEYLSGVMPVTSVFYLVFLALAAMVFYALRGSTARSLWLLLLSVGFYALMSPRGLLALVGFAAIAYVAALAMGDATGAVPPAGAATAPAPPTPDRRRRAIATATVIAAVIALAFFKFSSQIFDLIA